MNYYSGYFASESEEDHYNNFTGEKVRCSELHGENSGNKTWYIWDPFSENVLTGPFVKRPLATSGEVMKNKWAHWGLFETKRFFDDGYKGRTRLGFRNNDNNPGTVWYVGERNGRLFLWAWIRAPLLSEVVEFEKSDMASVRKLAEEEGNVAISRRGMLNRK